MTSEKMKLIFSPFDLTRLAMTREKGGTVQAAVHWQIDRLFPMPGSGLGL